MRLICWTMRLKRVKIFGFKTFADKAEFDIDGDLIAVVGPNGCGKSNLVDAILWGLGEGNSRHLRAQTGTDVIFNGSSKRKAVGYAEVVLLFDNEDGALPVPTPEVTISRRLTRSGDSEYAINRQTCRLRDVYDLLADSGLGRAGYAIVGQKDIDAALAASAEDRRGWVDEAAGVQRYRSRKVESLRRLASARDHLNRVNDILGEIETQREPLREEAEVAKRYKVSVGALREIESGLLVVEVAKAVKEVEELEARIEASSEVVEKEVARAEALEQQARQTGRQLSEVESEMDSVRATQQAALTSVERAQASQTLGEQRLASFDELESSLGEEAELSKSRLAEMQAEIENLRKESQTESEQFERISTECAGAGEEAKALSAKLREAELALAKARDIHAARLKADAESAHRAQRLREIERELKGVHGALPDIEKAEGEARAAFEAIQADVKAIEDELNEALRAVQAQEKAAEQEAQHARKLLAERASLDGRRRGIEATIDTHEGLAQGPRAVIEAAERGLLEGNYVPVGEAIEVDKEVAVAVETALGASINDLIVDDERDAKAAVNFLKQHRAGRATFQPIPLMRPLQQSPELRRLLSERDVVGIAANLVQCENRHRPVIDSLLGRVLVVEDLDAALRLAKTHGWSRMVTLEGEVVHSSGAVTGGHGQKAGYGLVQRKADLAEIIKDIEALDKQVAEIERAARKREAEKAKVAESQAEKRELLLEKRDEADEARNWWASVNEELSSTRKSVQRLEAEREKLGGSEEEALPEVDVAALEADRDQVMKALAARTADADQAESRLRDAEFRHRQAVDRLNMAERRLEAAQMNEHGRAKKLENLGPERERVRQEIERAKEELRQAETRKADADTRLNALTERKRELLEESFRLSEQVKEARANAQATGDAAHQAELSRARADARRAATLQRLVEEYGVSEEEAIEQAPSVELPDDAAQVAGRLRREIKAMGDVNVGAIEAYERLTERAGELAVQKDDIEGGIREVEASIRELDKLTRNRFLNTFNRVERSFQGMFQRVFPGGEGRLILTDPENVLESGIDIDVTLPGKKKQRLELLSGGERSLCATAFLFSLLKVKPSPLVVLDEVDAPLDGRNVERFIDLLKDFSSGKVWEGEPDDEFVELVDEDEAREEDLAPERVVKRPTATQFIVITHNPTTIEAAPVWLGVTMQEPGVSTLVPTRVRAVAEPAMLA